MAFELNSNGLVVVKRKSRVVAGNMDGGAKKVLKELEDVKDTILEEEEEEDDQVIGDGEIEVQERLEDMGISEREVEEEHKEEELIQVSQVEQEEKKRRRTRKMVILSGKTNTSLLPTLFVKIHNHF